MLDNIIPDYAAEAYATLRRTGFCGGLRSRDIAGEVIELACSDINDTPNYIEQGCDDDGCYAISAQWDDMRDATRHFANDDD